ncbi:MAG TPA: polysaccharide deacetylase family protein, partial [Flavobacteriales bacterium]|nr:polysaccharide deacetylase family protein [Flavobacteriales bacterium]
MYQDLEWSIPVSGPELFITFDDGPIPEITPRVLEILKAYNAK